VFSDGDGMEGQGDKTSQRPSIAIIILNWNTRDDVLECLDSLEKSAYPKNRLGLFVTDNASTDGSQKAIRAKLDTMSEQGWHELVLIENPKNLGFSGGNNAGYRRVDNSYEFIYLSNADVTYAEATLDHLASVMVGDPAIGVAGPKVLSYAEPDVLSHGAGYVGPLLCGTRSVDATEATPCDYVTGCALCVRHSVVEELAQLLDEEFFAYWEDTDLCARVRKLGYTVVYCPEATILHKVGASLPAGPEGLPPPARVYYATHSKYTYARRHLPMGPRLLFHLLFTARLPFFAVKTFVQSPRRTPALLKAYVLAMTHGLARKPGQKYPG
jgi:GT2 family glycosyltransferase